LNAFTVFTPQPAVNSIIQRRN